MTSSTQHRVEFRDTDAAGIARCSVFYPMLESAERESPRSYGISVHSNPVKDLAVQPVWSRFPQARHFVAAAQAEVVLTRVARYFAYPGDEASQWFSARSQCRPSRRQYSHAWLANTDCRRRADPGKPFGPFLRMTANSKTAT
jgi:hypothetical protein